MNDFQDEVDDTRKTLSFVNLGKTCLIHQLMVFSRRYALLELQKDVHEELLKQPEAERGALLAATKFAIFVVHNKKKPKLAEIPADTPLVYIYQNRPCTDVGTAP